MFHNQAEAAAAAALGAAGKAAAKPAPGQPMLISWDDASTLFRPERLSLFAGSEYSNERIYLLWLDFEDEPELWVYDANGESRYHDLAAYLQAYLAEDVSAASISWRA